MKTKRKLIEESGIFAYCKADHVEPFHLTIPVDETLLKATKAPPI
jgi:hypothetical protein